MAIQKPYKAVSRTITADELLARCSIAAQLLYHRLYLESDGEMRYYATPAILKGRLLPLVKTFDEPLVIESLDELKRRRRIRFYPAEGQDYLVVLGNRLDKPKTAAIHPAPPPGFSKPENEYIPMFMRDAGAPQAELTDKGEEPPPVAPAPAPALNGETCLLCSCKAYALSEKAAPRVLGAYCEARKRKGWCDPSQPDVCHQAVVAIAQRAKKYNAKLKAAGGGGVRDYPAYLSKCLHESLIEDADNMKQTGSR